MAKVYGDLCGTILCCPAKPSCTVLPRLCKNKKNPTANAIGYTGEQVIIFL